jgi:hypothetical protein
LRDCRQSLPRGWIGIVKNPKFIPCPRFVAASRRLIAEFSQKNDYFYSFTSGFLIVDAASRRRIDVAKRLDAPHQCRRLMGLMRERCARLGLPTRRNNRSINKLDV